MIWSQEKDKYVPDPKDAKTGNGGSSSSKKSLSKVDKLHDDVRAETEAKIAETEGRFKSAVVKMITDSEEPQ